MNTHIGFETSTIIIFSIVVIICLLIDLLAHRKNPIMTFRTSCIWTIFWILVSVLFGVYLWYHHNVEVASLFFTGYILEKSLSVDNLFVFMAIFTWFKIPEAYRHRVLYYGIIGAIVFRAIFVAIGSTFLYLLGQWVEIVFGIWVAVTAVLMIKSADDKDEIEDYSNHPAYRLTKWLLPIWPKLEGHYFFLNKQKIRELTEKEENKNISLKRTGLFFGTPLLLCLSVIELSDVTFAFDSVPAVIAVSKEPLIIYSAMIFAILGLRSMYFILESLKRYLCHLEKAVITLLFFIAFKLCFNAGCEIGGFNSLLIGNITSLIVIAVILALGVTASIIFPEKAPGSKKTGSTE